MKLSENWLREWVNPSLTSQQLAQQLTMAGLEVDSIQPAAEPFKGVVIGKIATLKPHPQTSNLSICEVDLGKAKTTVVTGAKNVSVQMKVPVALVGAQLPPSANKGESLQPHDFKGILSNGMLCSRQELGLGVDSEGIWALPIDAPLGGDLWEYLQLDDTLIEIDLTPNRGDCLSMLGLAREIAALNQLDLKLPTTASASPHRNEASLKVENEAFDFCPHYVARIINNIDAKAATPMWLQERLRRADLRSIHPVVDILNYVMLELGQPMHAFDLETLQLPLVVRKAQPNEKITLLDEREIQLQSDTVVIADQKGAQALAGIMGGKTSAVTEQTRHVVLESALFMPALIAGKARQYGLHTDASYRFERGVDPQLQSLAIERATALICEYCGGEPGALVELTHEATLPKPAIITLRYARIKQVLGQIFSRETVLNILKRLGCTVLSESGDGASWQIQPSTFRYDLTSEIDLIEEIIRIQGYDTIPSSSSGTQAELRGQAANQAPLARIKKALVDLGYQEVINYSFIEGSLQKLLFPKMSTLPLVNPISAEMSEMRLSLWPGMLNALKFNQNRQQSRVQFFEVGMCFRPSETGLLQENWISALICGDASSEQWGLAKRPVDFFDLKHSVEFIWQLLGHTVPLTFKASDYSACHPGQCAEVMWEGKSYGIVGKLHPQIQKALGIEGALYLFEINLALFELIPSCRFERPSRFPEIRRDIAMVVDEKLPSQNLVNFISNSAGEILRDVQIFDVYTGKGIDSGRKSVAMGLILQHPSRTLVDQEVDELIQRLIKGLEKEFNAKLRE